ncbi:MAG: heme exporter protein C [Flavobacteriales bacterium]
MDWTWFHRLGSPKWFYKKTENLVVWLAVLAILLAIVGCVWGLAFAPAELKQGNSYRIIFIHIPCSVVAMAGYFLMAISGAIGLIWRMKLSFMMMKSAALIGAALTFLSLVTGAIWGKPTWGTYWEWDARIIFMLILLFIYLGIVLLLEIVRNQDSRDQLVAILACVGTVFVPIIYKSVDWWYSLHQTASFKITGSSGIGLSMGVPIMIMVAAFYIGYTWYVIANTRSEILYRERKSRWVQDLIAEKGAAS